MHWGLSTTQEGVFNSGLTFHLKSFPEEVAFKCIRGSMSLSYYPIPKVNTPLLAQYNLSLLPLFSEPIKISSGLFKRPIFGSEAWTRSPFSPSCFGRRDSIGKKKGGMCVPQRDKEPVNQIKEAL